MTEASGRRALVKWGGRAQTPGRERLQGKKGGSVGIKTKGTGRGEGGRRKEREGREEREVGGGENVSGEMIGPPGEFDALVGDFIRFAHARGWRLAVLGVSEDRLPLYRAHGLHAVYHGDEAVLETAAFSLEGRAIRKVRQSGTRLEKSGYRVRGLAPREADAEIAAADAGVALEGAECRQVDMRGGHFQRLPIGAPVEHQTLSRLHLRPCRRPTSCRTPSLR